MLYFLHYQLEAFEEQEEERERKKGENESVIKNKAGTLKQ